MKWHLILSAVSALATSQVSYAAPVFLDTFDSYADGIVSGDATFNANYTSATTATNTSIESGTGLNGSKSVANSADRTLVRKNPADIVDPANGTIVLGLYFQQGNGSGTANPQLGIVTASNGSFTSNVDVGARVSSGGQLQIRNNNATAATGTNVALVQNNWYFINVQVTRLATTDSFNVAMDVYNASSNGTVGALVTNGSLAATAVSTNVWNDTTVFAALREGSNIPRFDNFSMSQVPEPAALGAIGIGATSLLSRRRRRSVA